ncbi:50S ribosomal protein L29 [Flavobacterium sp. xlx-214]|uniref:50S ribosomal protein L29 n=1 Tax=unclassified Flavobacterium TaxID=196869 RepID=UPI0013D5F742|nr:MULTISPECIES: 50S ribosomal protein L29 [unclassified Flavobacterium]MBA5792594.1 50S ribosomal protein L29 [Flavobacterium sp. xlx-221]QMI83743.1 50S ribosomal protein L29 [Flavobacterium sp. xlx-214]
MKKQEINNLSAAELEVKLNELTNQYAELRNAHAISPIANPLQLRTVRRAIARVKTALSKTDLQ